MVELMELASTPPRILLLIAAAVASSLSVAYAQQESSPGRSSPNIIFILADDLGYGDLGSYGQRKIRTPELDAMARAGTRFTQFYAGSTVCAPSRWALMTGMHMGHAYVRGNAGIPLRPEDTTVAEVLKEAGYVTGMFGKWGLGTRGTTGTPRQQGFDEFFGYLEHVHAHEYYTDHLWRDGQGLDSISVDTTQYTHDLFVEEALGFIDRHRDQPFFLYLPFTIPHAALSVPDSSLAGYLDEDGESLLRPEAPFPCCGVIGTYRGQPTPHAAFAAMITHMDGSVGRILDKLRRLGLDENTIVLFTSDNGPHIEGGAAPGFFESNGPLRGLKRDLYEGGIRVPMIAWGPGYVPAGRVSDQVWAMWDFLPTAATLAGVEAPGEVDGLSMVNALTGRGEQDDHEYLYWEFHNGWGRTYVQAIRQGDWKLMRFRAPDREPWVELYDLGDDAGEYHDLAVRYPAVVEALIDLMNRARTEPQVDQFKIPY